MITRIRILDMDNCISDDGWRIRYINSSAATPDECYRYYHTLGMWDDVGNQDLLNTDETIVVITSRPNAYRRQTREWLEDLGVRPMLLLMRFDNDHRPTVMVKEEAARGLIGLPDSVISSAYDDRPDIVAMYRRLGIDAYVRNIHAIDDPSWSPQEIRPHWMDRESGA